jgi:hypothetical protein
MLPYEAHQRDSRENTILYTGSNRWNFSLHLCRLTYRQNHRILGLDETSGLNKWSGELFMGGDVTEKKVLRVGWQERRLVCSTEMIRCRY